VDIIPACDWLKQLKRFTAILAETKQFWNCFVSVSFRFYFNCADSFSALIRRSSSKSGAPGTFQKVVCTNSVAGNGD